MIREYAVDPDAYTRNKDALQRFFTDFRADQGRVISAIPKKWEIEQQASIRAMGLPTVEQRKCFDELRKLSSTSVITGITLPRDINEWLEQARHAKKNVDIHAIITCALDEDNGEYNYKNLMFNQPPNWDIDQTTSVPRNAKSLAGAISSSLSVASFAMFIDPYFHPTDDRYRLPFIAFLNRLSSGRCPCRRALVYTAIHEGKTRADLQRGLTEHVQPLLPAGFEVELSIWPSNQMHDRFVLTKQVGYSFGHGLDEAAYQGAIEVNIHRLAETARQAEYRKFSNTAIRQGDPIVIVGT
ncbi:hypothetical protein UA38_16710 [Photobacterium kishitanii]|uniref:Uncharacterized protein n=1 Tax=Photobacterium kishitanii TaxID=318456 RepID=A0AAX0YXX9_9GAMM|nr:hypothetical protein [Photobacterium kishitanii]KJG56006.1 hypothetical protein UA38_16710 [Photobacterium kishitanii]KJG62864.1 hypothetical protein UA42_00105 [Photobacterium kishitanii]KJG64203.1 hypothetical protein UA40_17840 [Photobacterium kishitanii]KJG68769.1 hypothetical protein UA41_15120 [Photobacterium kishitanii]PSX20031.1 hypothetical protein C0W70_08765 [Photobacterium kishitanii]